MRRIVEAEVIPNYITVAFSQNSFFQEERKSELRGNLSSKVVLAALAKRDFAKLFALQKQTSIAFEQDQCSILPSVVSDDGFPLSSDIGGLVARKEGISGLSRR